MEAMTEEDLRQYAEDAREIGWPLVVTTLSGSKYLLEPLMGKRWAITRTGEEGGPPTSEIGRVTCMGGFLSIGSWTTTGLQYVDWYEGCDEL